jgi:hypothetical protein
MNFTVLWRPVAEQRLAAIWASASDRNAVTRAAHAIDEALGTDPEQVGESRADDVRILFEEPLGALFTETRRGSPRLEPWEESPPSAFHVNGPCDNLGPWK